MNTNSSRVAEWKARNPERARANALRSYYHRKATQTDFALKHQLSNIKTRAKANGLPFNLTMETLPPMPERCPALNIPLARGGKGSPNGPELDRLVPALGYVVGNVQWISRRANCMKSDATLEEVDALAAWLRKHIHP